MVCLARRVTMAALSVLPMLALTIAALPDQPRQETGWTADASQAAYPSHIASGSLHGHPFTLGRATVEPFHEWSATVGEPASRDTHVDGNVLRLQGKSDLPMPDNAFTIFLALKHGEKLDGRTFIVPASVQSNQTARVRDRDGQGWFTPLADVQGPSYFAGKLQNAGSLPMCSMRVTFGTRRNGALPGQIYLAMKDAEKSYVAGTFEAAIQGK